MHEHNHHITDAAEFVKRLSIFADNDDLIEIENAKNLSYKLGHNPYSIYTNEEFREMMGLNRPLPAHLSQKSLVEAVVEDSSVEATSVDWVSAGYVTGVKNQGNCGSCWSFSTTGALEGAYKKRYGVLNSFSEQNLVSCDNADSACNGGWMDTAFKWIQGNGGLCTESAYPYTSGSTGTKGTCYTSCTKVSGSKIVSYTDLGQTESQLQAGVDLQPVSVAVDASSAWQMYSSGVFTGSCTNNVNHGVLNVGYGTWTDGTPYWKVKNSWGTGWGQGGYIYMQRNTGTYGGKCGIALYASYCSV
jgi:C1A family cysteine protease